MITAERTETYQEEPLTKSIRRGVNSRVLLITAGVLAALSVIGMLPRWRVNAELANAVRDQRPTVSVVAPARHTIRSAAWRRRPMS